MIYKIKYSKQDKTYYADPVQATLYPMPPKIYGDSTNIANVVWNEFLQSGSKSVGAMFVGFKGSGKSLTIRQISNLATQAGLSVFLVEDLEGKVELGQWLANLRNCVIVLDEFSKSFPYWIQDKMLNLFADDLQTHKLFLLSENYENKISEFISNRPGRILFNVKFEKLSLDIINEYLDDHNVTNKTIREDIIKFSKSNLEFSIDHLIAIVNFHKKYPTFEFKHIERLLNIKSNSSNTSVYTTYSVLYAIEEETDSIVEVSNISVRSMQLNPDESRLLDFRVATSDNNIKQLTLDTATTKYEIEDNTLTYFVNGYKVVFYNIDATDYVEQKNNATELITHKLSDVMPNMKNNNNGYTGKSNFPF
ncbi:hypothetical protein ACVWU4_000907 [Campylobacter coli]